MSKPKRKAVAKRATKSRSGPSGRTMSQDELRTVGGKTMVSVRLSPTQWAMLEAIRRHLGGTQSDVIAAALMAYYMVIPRTG